MSTIGPQEHLPPAEQRKGDIAVTPNYEGLLTGRKVKPKFGEWIKFGLKYVTDKGLRSEVKSDKKELSEIKAAIRQPHPNFDVALSSLRTLNAKTKSPEIQSETNLIIGNIESKQTEVNMQVRKEMEAIKNAKGSPTFKNINDLVALKKQTSDPQIRREIDELLKQTGKEIKEYGEWRESPEGKQKLAEQKKFDAILNDIKEQGGVNANHIQDLKDLQNKTISFTIKASIDGMIALLDLSDEGDKVPTNHLEIVQKLSADPSTASQIKELINAAKKLKDQNVQNLREGKRIDVKGAEILGDLMPQLQNPHDFLKLSDLVSYLSLKAGSPLNSQFFTDNLEAAVSTKASGTAVRELKVKEGLQKQVEQLTGMDKTLAQGGFVPIDQYDIQYRPAYSRVSSDPLKINVGMTIAVKQNGDHNIHFRTQNKVEGEDYYRIVNEDIMVDLSPLNIVDPNELKIVWNVLREAVSLLSPDELLQWLSDPYADKAVYNQFVKGIHNLDKYIPPENELKAGEKEKILAKCAELRNIVEKFCLESSHVLCKLGCEMPFSDKLDQSPDEIKQGFKAKLEQLTQQGVENISDAHKETYLDWLKLQHAEKMIMQNKPAPNKEDQDMIESLIMAFEEEDDNPFFQV